MTAETKQNFARFGLMVVVYLIFASSIPSYYSVPGIASLLDSAVLAGVLALGL